MRAVNAPLLALYTSPNARQQDGDLTTVGSRWSCKPALGSDDSTCSVTYTLGDTLVLEGLNIGEFDVIVTSEYIGGCPTTQAAVCGSAVGAGERRRTRDEFEIDFEVIVLLCKARRSSSSLSLWEFVCRFGVSVGCVLSQIPRPGHLLTVVIKQE